MIISCGSRVIADKVKIADSFLSRFIGLMGRKSLDEGEGLLLLKCSSIHCFFMKIPIDVVYISKDMKVLYKETIRPWRIGKIIRGARHVLELAEGKAGVDIGEIIDISQ